MAEEFIYTEIESASYFSLFVNTVLRTHIGNLKQVLLNLLQGRGVRDMWSSETEPAYIVVEFNPDVSEEVANESADMVRAMGMSAIDSVRVERVSGSVSRRWERVGESEELPGPVGTMTMRMTNSTTRERIPIPRRGDVMILPNGHRLDLRNCYMRTPLIELPFGHTMEVTCLYLPSHERRISMAQCEQDVGRLFLITRGYEVQDVA